VPQTPNLHGLACRREKALAEGGQEGGEGSPTSSPAPAVSVAEDEKVARNEDRFTFNEWDIQWHAKSRAQQNLIYSSTFARVHPEQRPFGPIWCRFLVN
jgi:hypothetical protein